MFNLRSANLAIHERASQAKKVIARSWIPVWKLWAHQNEAQPESIPDDPRLQEKQIERIKSSNPESPRSAK